MIDPTRTSSGRTLPSSPTVPRTYFRQPVGRVASRSTSVSASTTARVVRCSQSSRAVSAVRSFRSTSGKPRWLASTSSRLTSAFIRWASTRSPATRAQDCTNSPRSHASGVFGPVPNFGASGTRSRRLLPT